MFKVSLDDLQGTASPSIEESNKNSIHKNDIAIIGISAKFSNSANANEYWSNLESGVDLIRPIPGARRTDIDNYLLNTGRNEDIDYQELSYIDDIDKFDYKFFKLSPQEAIYMDPAQRVFLETAWSTIEDAGYGGGKLNGTRTGVYIGYSDDANYKRIISEHHTELSSLAHLGNMKSFIGGRISYVLNLRGPSLLIDTACSASLVAVHHACQGIRNGDCDMALAGGVKIVLFPFVNKEKVKIMSDDGRTRTFDENSEGMGGGEGSAAILLKPLDKAIKDKDTIYAVIKGSAVNQDGSSIGITAPNPAAQEDLISRALAAASISPETVTYFEAHGTGTKLGDPIEVESLKRVFEKVTDKKQFCAIGSVKTNLGHLDSAAGIAALIKVILMLKHKKIPPIVNFTRPSKKIAFHKSPVYINNILSDWETDGFPRRSCISSFGLSGTNCHVVLEEYAGQKSSTHGESHEVFTISAESIWSLKELVKRYENILGKSNTSMNLRDICYTANTCREHYKHRIAIETHSVNDLQSKLVAISKDLTCCDTLTGVYSSIGDKAPKPISNNLCAAYIGGKSIDWNKICSNECYKVNLPAYPFEKLRCWVKYDNLNNNSDCYFNINWVESDSPHIGSSPKLVLILKDSIGKSLELKEYCTKQGSQVMDVDVRNFGESDFFELFESLKTKELTDIVHMSTINNNDEIKGIKELNSSQLEGLYSMYHIARALHATGINQSKVNISVVSQYVNEITQDEKLIKPENSPLFGIARAIGVEHINLKVKCIDIDDTTPLDIIAREIFSETFGTVGYRQGKRFIQEIAPAELSTTSSQEVSIKENGVYVITGGTGGMGLEMAKFLAEKNKINLALISRSKLPKGSDKEELIADIEKAGSKIHLYNADVADESQLAPVIKSIIEKLGEINGIIHCAGAAGDGFLIHKDLDSFNKVVLTKINGTWLLNKLTENQPLDFFVSFSSLATVLIPAGQADYIAANEYLNAFANFRRRLNKKTLTINWAGWKETGMAVKYKIADDSVFKLMLTSDALQRFQAVLNKKLSNIYIGNIDYSHELLKNTNELPIKISQSLEAKINSVSSKMSPKAKEELPSVALSGKNGLYTDTEMLLAKIWGSILGMSQINIQDDFFSLGGHSLLAIRLEIYIRKHIGDIEYSDIYKYPTIEKMAAFVDSRSEALHEQ